MARKTLYDRLDSLDVNIANEYNSLIKLLKIEKKVWNGYRDYTVIEYINKNYFRNIPTKFRYTYLSVEDMMSGFELKDISNSLDDLFLLSELCIMLLPYQYTIQNSDLHDQSTTIHENILCFLEKLNYKLVSIDNERRIIVEKNPATTQAVALVDDTTAISLIEYNHYALKGNLVKKRQILTSLGAFIEPILKSRILNNSGYKQLESDVGFMLNNFHVRHNNKEGAKAQEYIVSLNEAQLEEWYDKLYNAILSVIIINEHIPTQNHIATLKTTHKWKA